MTQIFHSDQPSHGGDRKTFEITISTLSIGTLGSVASLLVATLYQGNPDRNLIYTQQVGAAAAETSVVLNGVICEVSTYTVTIYVCRST